MFPYYIKKIKFKSYNSVLNLIMGNHFIYSLGADILNV